MSNPETSYLRNLEEFTYCCFDECDTLSTHRQYLAYNVTMKVCNQHSQQLAAVSKRLRDVEECLAYFSLPPPTQYWGDYTEWLYSTRLLIIRCLVQHYASILIDLSAEVECSPALMNTVAVVEQNEMVISNHCRN